MKEKILALLVAKFSGVRKDGLARLAEALSLQATTDDEAGALVEKLTADKVGEFATNYRKDVDKEVSDSNKTFETNLKKKYDFSEKKAEPGKTEPPLETEVPAWAKSLIEVNQKAMERLANLETGKTNESRLQSLEGKLEDVPATFKAQKIKDFKRMNFDTEEAFNEYLTETESDIAAFNQEMADKGLSQQSRPMFGKANPDGVSKSVQDFIDSKTKPESSLGGKEV